MTTPEIAAADIVTFEDLTSLASAKGPCITLVTPLPNPLEIQAHLKNAIRGIENKLAERGTDPSTSAALVKPLHALAASIEVEGTWANAFVLFRAPDILRHYWLQELHQELITVDGKFHIRPLLPVLSREPRFYVLALSQKQTQLFHGTRHRLEEVSLRGTPQNLRDWLNIRQPDHDLENRAAGGPSVGAMKGVLFGTSSDREREDEYLAHFFKEIDKGLRGILHEETAPLLLTGVEYEIALYRTVNTYPHLREKAIHGSPDGFTNRELHQRAMEIVSQSFCEPLQKALADFERRRNLGRVFLRGDEIVKAAFESRVSDLLLADDAEYWGAWNEETFEIQTDPRDGIREDLLNTAALQTLLHGGRAFGLQRQDMPEKAETAALLRF
jgi:hypothetical protein